MENENLTRLTASSNAFDVFNTVFSEIFYKNSKYTTGDNMHKSAELALQYAIKAYDYTTNKIDKENK
jgi:hypothetical protein